MVVEPIRTFTDLSQSQQKGCGVVRLKQFPQIPGPIRTVVIQTNGPLWIDINNRSRLVNPKQGRVYPETFSLLEQAKKEASSISFINDPSRPSPTWKERSK